MAKVKYLGSADRRVLPKGENFGGRLAEPLTKEIVFERDNYFVVDTDEAGLSADALALLLKQPDFKDVSDAKRLPLSAHEKTFGGFPNVDDEDILDGDAEEPKTDDNVDGAVNESGKAEQPGGGTVTGGPTTTVGGSTPGDTGGAARAGRGGGR